MNTNNRNREYFPESEINGGDLLAGLNDESVTFLGISATGERWYRRKHMPVIFGKPEIVNWAERDDGLIEGDDEDVTADVRAEGIARLRAAFNATGKIEQDLADCDEDQEAELRELRAAAIERLNEQIEQIRVSSWTKGWTPDSDREGGLDGD